MADITMCEDKICPLKNKCYRFLARPDTERQSYFAEKVRKGNNTCEYFLPVKKNEKP